jgi:TrmH family RNA methyltransferase
MLSKNKIKELSSFGIKKYRDQEAVFVAEGSKLVNEFLPVFKCKTLVATNEWIAKNNPVAVELITATEEGLRKISQLKTPQQVFAVFEQPSFILPADLELKDISLALDDIQDPGNMGTILRIADWFGIETVFCSEHCVDIFNPKTVQASMGAIARVKVYSVDLPAFLQEQKGKGVPVYGTFLNGATIYTEKLPQRAIVVMGNEGNGISSIVKETITNRLFIPNFPKGKPTSESLNVAVATAIVCSEFRRR